MTAEELALVLATLPTAFLMDQDEVAKAYIIAAAAMISVKSSPVLTAGYFRQVADAIERQASTDESEKPPLRLVPDLPEVPENAPDPEDD